MATSLAAQLAQVSAQSKSTLNVKAQRSAHSKSLLFEPRVAAAQTFQSIYSICVEGFEELCHLDSRFAEYGSTLFSSASQDEDRTQMTATENAKLDKIIDSFLRLVGSRLRLLPAIKTVEWLIRRFRIHEFNTRSLLSAFLPYHTIPAFKTLMSILPAQLPQEFRFLDPYVKSLTSPPRAAIIQHCIARPDLLTTISAHTLESCRTKTDYPSLISFWGGVMVQTVNGLLDKNRSGRKSIQMDNDQAFSSQIIPVLSECLVMKDAPGIQIASYMVVTLVAGKGSLGDSLLSAFMEQIVVGWTPEVVRPGLVCLCILAQQRSAKQLPGKVTKSLIKVADLAQILHELQQDYRVDKLANGLALALVDRLEKKGDARSLPIIKSLLSQHLLQDKQTKVLYKALLVAAHRIKDEVDLEGRIRKGLGSTLVSLSQIDGETGDIIRKAIEEVDFNIEELELKLDTAIRPRLAIEQPQEDAVMENHDFEAAKGHIDLGIAIERLSKEAPAVSSCLTTEPSDIFNDLCSLFLIAASGQEETSQFEAIPVLSRPRAHLDSFYFSFYIRVWSGPYPALARAAALEQVKQRLKDTDCASIDFQAIIPYAIAAMSDRSKKVRRAAADLMIVLGNSYLESASDKRPIWGSADLFEDGKSLEWMDLESAKCLFQKVVLPALEETVLHENHVLAAFKSALDSSRASEGSESDKKRQISRHARLSIMKFLSGQTICTPLLSVKIRLLHLLNQISKTSSTTRTELLLPILSWWTGSLGKEDASRVVAKEGLDEPSFDEACVEIVVANDEKGVDLLFEVVKNPQNASRVHLIQSVFARLTALWPSMKREMQFSTAQKVLDLCQLGPETGSPLPHSVTVEAAELLRSVGLTTEILLSFLESAREANRQAIEPPANKRRRISSPIMQARGVDSQQNSSEANLAINRTTFVLELVQESTPAKHPELLHSLFLILSDLQQLRTLVGSELGYLQNITLSSLLAMTPSDGGGNDLAKGASVSHGDVLASCIQKSTSPAVINAALLLVASLARTAPDVVLHSVMPILTFMGSSVLRQADDYSAHVVNQTIKEVIPPLIDTFRKKRQNLVASTAELLSSFVVAYEHIPPHRKRDTFILLIQNLGPEDFLFALLAMFVDKYGTTDSGLAFLMDVMGSFGVEIQLQALTKLLDLVSDLFKPKPSLSAALLGKHETGETDPQKLAHRIALKELTLVPQLLANTRLRKEIAHLDGKEDDMEVARIRDLYAVLLETLLTLADTLKTNRILHGRCGDALSNLLNLLSTSEFIKSVETLLDRPNVALRQRVLRALEVRVDRESTADAASRAALLAFLPQLTAVIRESDDMNYKQTAVVCVDKIAEKYGKKDPDAVAAAAETIAGDQCLGQPFHRLRIMALLCLASLVDVLQDGIVPVLPSAIPKALKYLQESLDGEIQDVELHNAAFAFITGLAQHLPYMISGAYLDQLLECANVSAIKCAEEEEAKEQRLQCIQFVAKLVDPKVLFAALLKNWNKAASLGVLAILEYLQLLGTALDKHTKAAVSKNIPTLSTILLQVLDFRREDRIKDTGRDLASTSPDQIQNALNEVALKMIYKLNDAAFRPIFSQLMEWATSGLSKQDIYGRRLRHESVFSFLVTFFESLKSIVTSYASYVIEPAADIMKQANLRGSPDERVLWQRVLTTLTKCFEHDQDGFWQAPAHFNAVTPVLVEQFVSAPLAGVDVASQLIPAVVELAAAADSKEHHKDINTPLLKLLRHEKAAVRLAVLKCQQALTKRLGEEWLQALPEMLPYISELQDDDDEVVERENRRWIVGIEEILGESLDSMLQ